MNWWWVHILCIETLNRTILESENEKEREIEQRNKMLFRPFSYCLYLMLNTDILWWIFYWDAGPYGWLLATCRQICIAIFVWDRTSWEISWIAGGRKNLPSFSSTFLLHAHHVFGNGEMDLCLLGLCCKRIFLMISIFYGSNCVSLRARVFKFYLRIYTNIFPFCSSLSHRCFVFRFKENTNKMVKDVVKQSFWLRAWHRLNVNFTPMQQQTHAVP